MVWEEVVKQSKGKTLKTTTENKFFNIVLQSTTYFMELIVRAKSRQILFSFLSPDSKHRLEETCPLASFQHKFV